MDYTLEDADCLNRLSDNEVVNILFMLTHPDGLTQRVFHNFMCGFTKDMKQISRQTINQI